MLSWVSVICVFIMDKKKTSKGMDIEVLVEITERGF